MSDIPRREMVQHLREAMNDLKESIERSPEWSEDRRIGLLSGARLVAYYLINVTNRTGVPGTCEDDVKAIES